MQSDNSLITLFFRMLNMVTTTISIRYCSYNVPRTAYQNLELEISDFSVDPLHGHPEPGWRGSCTNENEGNWRVGGDWGPIMLLLDALHRHFVIQGIGKVLVLVFGIWYLGR